MEYLSKLCGRRVVPVGPIVGDAIDNDSDHAIIRWLDGKNRSSTIYIACGSEFFLTKDQTVAIAKGLEQLTNVNFIWVARSLKKEEEEDLIPKGFVGKTKGRGIVLNGLAPQARILAHPNVAAFMSHCGWGSIMESIYFGVPVIALPQRLEQPVACRLVVEKGIGVEVGRDEEGKFDGEGVAKAIKEVVEDDKEMMRGRVREMSDKIRKGQEKVLCEAVEELSRLIVPKVQ